MIYRVPALRIPGSRTIKKIWTKLNLRGIVFMYHRVADFAFDPRQLNVSPVHFEEQMRVLKKYGRVVQMQEMGRNLRNLSFRGLEIVVTFDDGYADNFYTAKPILEKFDIPATFFIVTGSIGSREEFFGDNLEQVILASQTLPAVFEVVVDGQQYRWQIIPAGPCQASDYKGDVKGIPQHNAILSRFELYKVLNRIIGCLKVDRRKDALQRIAKWAGKTLITRAACLSMTCDELKSLANCSLFEIGAHTISHPRLSFLSPERQKEEIFGSKMDLENKLNRKITSFSFPNGNYSDETVKIVRGSGFQNASTIVRQPVTRNADRYLLPRFAVGDWNGEQFEEKLKFICEAGLSS